MTTNEAPTLEINYAADLMQHLVAESEYHNSAARLGERVTRMAVIDKALDELNALRDMGVTVIFPS